MAAGGYPFLHHSTHVTGTGRNRYHRIMLRNDDAKLTECTIPPVTVVSTTPELIPISLIPVIVGVTARGWLVRGRLLNPCF